MTRMTGLRGLRKRKMELIDEIEHIKNEVCICYILVLPYSITFFLRNVDAELESLYYVDEGSKSRSKLIFIGKKKFNQDPMKGIEFLSERGLLDKQPSAVAQWLFKDLINPLRKNVSLIIKFMCLIIRYGLNIFILLFLWSFRLPGESQKIDRIMERFARQYVATNEGVFDCADTCYTISYSCIMLNTLLHNPNVKDRPSFDLYQTMNRELLEAGSVSIQTLSAVYESIRSQEFKIPEDDAGRLSELFLHSEREGWLYKQSSSQFISGPLSWKRRWLDYEKILVLFILISILVFCKLLIVFFKTILNKNRKLEVSYCGFSSVLCVSYLFSVDASHHCTTCGSFLGEDRKELLEHYHSPWHRFIICCIRHLALMEFEFMLLMFFFST
uniref:SEC7 domain-containing protein n=1 Tax=Heterorhabditis bacteriophora TaxID=37862 RepID=A0A1I7WCK6_HETBA